MSDLAPFVAAVLKDRTVADLKDENVELREQRDGQRDGRLVVQITGPGGTPIHYEASLANGYSSGGGESWTIDLEQRHDDAGNGFVVSLIDIEELEIRLGGVAIQRFNRNALDIGCDILTTDFDRDNKMEPQMGGIMFVTRSECDGPLYTVHGRIGRILWEDYSTLAAGNNIEWDELMDTQARDLIITGLEFRKREIRGIITLLEDMGISTSTNWSLLSQEQNDEGDVVMDDE